MILRKSKNKRYHFRFNGMWGRCKHCFDLLTDSDHIYGCGYCQSCDIKLASRGLKKLISTIKKDLEG